jgi:hypothetical protein
VVLSPIAAIGLAILGFLWFPVKCILSAFTARRNDIVSCIKDAKLDMDDILPNARV